MTYKRPTNIIESNNQFGKEGTTKDDTEEKVLAQYFKIELQKQNPNFMS